METIIGFVAGYLVGTSEGKAGLRRLRESAAAIQHSPELRNLMTSAVTVAGEMAKQASSRGLSTAGQGVVRAITDRVAGPGREDSRAA